jgi:hypothetical protein
MWPFKSNDIKEKAVQVAFDNATSAKDKVSIFIKARADGTHGYLMVEESTDALIDYIHELETKKDEA